MTLRDRFRYKNKQFCSDTKGIAYVEFALSIGVFLLLFLGSVEITRYILIVQKLENTVATLADVTTQTNTNAAPLTSSQLNTMMSAIPDMMSPYPYGSSGLVILTDVTQAGGSPLPAPTINWQYCANSGTLSTTSRIGTVIDGPATLPAGFSMIAGEEVVIGEIFYAYVPITAQAVMSATTVYRTAIFMPRLGALSGFTSSCP